MNANTSSQCLDLVVVAGVEGHCPSDVRHVCRCSVAVQLSEELLNDRLHPLATWRAIAEQDACKVADGLPVLRREL
jgi:hypothetical protein